MELTDLSAVALAKLVREKQISPVELVHTHLSRIRDWNPALNAFVHLRAEEALQDAQSVEDDIQAGNIRPLAGVPISVKSCIDVNGTACEAGLRSRADYIAQSDATVVARMKAAGAILIGTTNTAESLLAYHTDNPLYGRTSNPWDLERTAGGSSGGESAAIASGMSAAGLGSDGGGSVRVPAHFTGICALKPTPGRLPGTGHFPECIGPWAMMGVIGPMARTVEDLRVLFATASGADDGDPFAASFAEVAPMSIRGARIGVLETRSPASPDLQWAVREAATALQDQGAIVEPFRFARFDDAIEIWQMIFVRAAHELMRDSDPTASMYGTTITDFLDYAGKLPPLTAKTLLNGLLERDRIRAEFLCAFRPYTALLSPPCSEIAFRHGEGGWGEHHPADYIRTMQWAQLANVLGLPAAVVPVLRSSEDLPVGVQLLGRPYAEPILLDVAALLDESFGFVAPPLANVHAAASAKRASATSPDSGQRR